MAVIERRRIGKSFAYYQNGKRITDPSKLERIAKLAVPPAWKSVEIAASPRSKVQAKGYDSAGRMQAIYNASFRLRQEKQKYERILEFAQALPKLRRQLDKDLRRKRLGKEKVLACIVRLIDEQYFRVGNDQYARENQSYGITTLQSKHVDVTTTTVTFDFVGKSGQEHHKKVHDPQIARIIRQLDEMPGHEIFRYQDENGVMHDLHSNDVNEYIKTYTGGNFTAKDFRTWGGTLLAASALLKEELEEDATKTKRAKAASAIIKDVAKRLGNTPAVTRSSYIDPRVFKLMENEARLRELRDAMTVMKPKKYMTVEEQCVLRILKSD